MKPLLVTAAVITSQDGKILIAKRRQDVTNEPGKWEFPGGKVEFGETPEHSLIREIREELSLEIQIESLFDVASHVYQTPSGPLHIVLIAYHCRTSGEAKAVEVADFKWIEKAQLIDFDFAAADLPFIEKLR